MPIFSQPDLTKHELDVCPDQAYLQFGTAEAIASARKLVKKIQALGKAGTAVTEPIYQDLIVEVRSTNMACVAPLGIQPYYILSHTIQKDLPWHQLNQTESDQFSAFLVDELALLRAVPEGVPALMHYKMTGLGVLDRVERRFPSSSSLVAKMKAGIEEDMKAGIAMELADPGCSSCGKETTTLQRCSGCKISKYCSVQCQKHAWNQSHKVACKERAQLAGTI